MNKLEGILLGAVVVVAFGFGFLLSKPAPAPTVQPQIIQVPSQELGAASGPEHTEAQYFYDGLFTTAINYGSAGANVLSVGTSTQTTALTGTQIRNLGLITQTPGFATSTFTTPSSSAIVSWLGLAASKDIYVINASGTIAAKMFLYNGDVGSTTIRFASSTMADAASSTNYVSGGKSAIWRFITTDRAAGKTSVLFIPFPN